MQLGTAQDARRFDRYQQDAGISQGEARKVGWGSYCGAKLELDIGVFPGVIKVCAGTILLTEAHRLREPHRATPKQWRS
jgi:hypothetical protein